MKLNVVDNYRWNRWRQTKDVIFLNDVSCCPNVRFTRRLFWFEWVYSMRNFSFTVVYCKKTSSIIVQSTFLYVWWQIEYYLEKLSLIWFGVISSYEIFAAIYYLWRRHIFVVLLAHAYRISHQDRRYVKRTLELCDTSLKKIHLSLPQRFRSFMMIIMIRIINGSHLVVFRSRITL